MPDLTKLRNLAGALKEKRSATPHGRPRWYDIRNASPASTSVYIYDMIGDDGWGGGISARDFVSELTGITSSIIDLHISSEGGEVFDGIAIYEALKQHSARVVVNIDSLAASAASFIAMAGDEIRIGRNARMMIHDAAMGGAYASGNAKDMREFAANVLEMADLLDDMSLNIADIYAQRAGGTATEWRARMQAETWYDAPSAVAAGLADGVIGESTDIPGAPAQGDSTVEDSIDLDALRAAIEGAFNA